MTRVTCSDCKQETDVPFTPSPDRPVYCNDCFRKKRAAGPTGGRGGPGGDRRGGSGPGRGPRGAPREARPATPHGFRRQDYPGFERFAQK